MQQWRVTRFLCNLTTSHETRHSGRESNYFPIGQLVMGLRPRNANRGSSASTIRASLQGAGFSEIFPHEFPSVEASRFRFYVRPARRTSEPDFLFLNLDFLSCFSLSGIPSLPLLLAPVEFQIHVIM